MDILKSRDGTSACWFANYRESYFGNSIYDSITSGNKILIGYSHISKSFDDTYGRKVWCG